MKSSGMSSSQSGCEALGGDDTTRRVVLIMCENNFWPERVYLNSANPVGCEWLEGMIKRYKR